MDRGSQPASEMTIRERMAMEILISLNNNHEYMQNLSEACERENASLRRVLPNIAVGRADALLAALEQEQGE